MASDKRNSDMKLQQGIAQHFKGKTIAFGGGEHKLADVTGLLQNNVDMWNKHEQAKLVSHDALVKANASEAAIAPTRRALVAYVVAHFGASNPLLADFGITPKKDRRSLNTDEKSLMVKRIRATREARGTMGKREREKIHGTIDGAPVVVAQTPAPPVVVQAPPIAYASTNGTANGSAVLSLNGHS